MSLIKHDARQQALVKTAQASYRPLKRPAVVLEEDDYIDGLSRVIKRQFFPDLHALHAESGNSGNLGSSSLRTTSATTPRLSDNSKTRHQNEADPLDRITLGEYQASYTSEDNASFLSLLDKQNLLQREKYAWHYNGNKIYSANSLRHQQRLEDARKRDAKSIGGTDDRQHPNGWQITPNNALLFLPEAPDELQDHRPQMNTISIANTSVPDDARLQTAARSQNMRDSEDEEPLVNGYGFIEEPDSPLPQRTRVSRREPEAETVARPNPFKIAESSNRERLHEALLLKSRKSSTPRPSTSANLRRTIATPKFKSSPVLSPAAHRLLASKTSGLRERLRTPLPKSNLK